MHDFHGLRAAALENEHLRLEYLLEGGLRIVRLMLPGSTGNFLAETPDFGWDTPAGWYALRGGHRVWEAPQSPQNITLPETQPLQIETWEGGVRIFQPAAENTRVDRQIEVQLEEDRAAAVVRHIITNRAQEPVTVSAWAITQVPLGGRFILPLADRPPVTRDLGPDRNLVFWPYVRLPDPRLEIQDRMVVFDARAREDEFKLGCFTPHGWVAYAWHGFLFRKRFSTIMGLTYPDMGCNVEVYCNHQFAEMETLGPLKLLAPGESVEHEELWEFEPLEEGPA